MHRILPMPEHGHPSPLGSIRKLPFAELVLPPPIAFAASLQSSRGRSGGRAITDSSPQPEGRPLDTGGRRITSTPAANPQPEGCPPSSVLGQPPFDLMLFVSPEWNVSLVKAMMDWVSRRTGEEGA